ncbi:uncharacterized protein ARMOST_06971 [Armillaria ostoyae]|uniref:Uncharacterized protein n=1 Tax=Armillaria ostoyae TaxID=47428 RepID=A0A284R4H0_ARMOS|nr:uncharacterized protein ARMOST_06971 [Armillaria ostoyae]
MSNSIEYHQSATPKPYESTLMLEGLTLDQYKLLTEECAAIEEKYEEALGVYEEWKAIKAKEVQLEKLKADKEAQKAAEEKKKEKERQVAILKEKQEAKDKQKKLHELKVKEIVDAEVEKKKQDDLKKREKKKL